MCLWETGIGCALGVDFPHQYKIYCYASAINMFEKAKVINI